VAALSVQGVRLKLLISVIPGSNPAMDMEVSLVSVVCCQVEVSASGRSLAQRSPTGCDREASTVGGLGPPGAVAP
jgi:hypothetical protein